MACDVLLADETRRGIDDAVGYIASSLCEPTAAAELLKAFDEFADKVALFPEMYPLCSEERLALLGIRKALVEAYIALYLVKDSAVYIIGFFHQSQDYAKLV